MNRSRVEQIQRRVDELFQLAGRHPWLTFAVLFAVSFATRAAILTQVPREWIVGTGEAGRIAAAIVREHSFADPYAVPTGPTAHTTPFYPFLVAGLISLFGDGYAGGLARCIVLISAYSAMYALFPTLASRFGMPVKAGIAAGLLAALLPVKRSAEVFRGWDEPFAALALAGLLLVALAVTKRRAMRGWGMLGAASGAAMYVNATLASAVAALALLDLLAHRSWATLRGWAAVGVVAAAVMSPWLIRNRLVLGDWVFMRDTFGLELRYSNHEGAAASSELLNSRRESVLLHPSNNPAEAEVVARLGEVEYNRREMHLALNWIRGHPKDFAVLSVQRFFYFWLGPPQHAFEFLVTAAYTILGLIGLRRVRIVCGARVFAMWSAVLISYPLVYYCVEYLNRYRVAMDWMLWLSAGLLLSGMLPARARGEAATAASLEGCARQAVLK